MGQDYSTYSGICSYCGSIERIMAKDQIDADRMVTESCECGGQKVEEAKEKAEDILAGDICIQAGFKQMSDDFVTFAKDAIEHIHKKNQKKIAINLEDSKFQIKQSKDRIEVVRERTLRIQENTR